LKNTNYKNIFFLISLFTIIIFFTISYSPPLISQYEAGEIYWDFLPIDKRMLVFSISEDPVTSGHFNNTFGYAFLIISRYISDIFGYNLSIIRLPSIIYGLISLLLFFYIIKKWLNSKVAFLTIFLLSTNEYFLIFQHLLLPQMITLLMMFFMIYRFQKFKDNENFINIFFLALAFCFCSLNYITARLFAISLLIFYLFVPDKFSITDVSTYKDILSKKRLKKIFLIFAFITTIFTILYPGNLFLFFSKEFIFPSIRLDEFNPGVIDIIKNIFLNLYHFLKVYIFDFSSTPSDLLIHRPYRIENLLIIFFTLVGIYFLLFKRKDYTKLLILFVFIVNFILPLMSAINQNNEQQYTLSVHRLFFLVPFLLLLSSIGIFYIYDQIKLKKVKNFIFIIFCLFVIFRISDIHLKNNNFLNIVNVNKINIPNKPFSKDIEIEDNKDISRFEKHYNQLYFHQMAKYIASQISNINEIPEESVIYVNENFFTPNNYYFAGGDLPRKNYPYYFKMFLSIYLNENNLMTKYLVKIEDIKDTRFQKALKVLHRYEKGLNTKDEYPRNSNQENILNLLILILNQVKKIEFLDNKIENIQKGNSLYKDKYFNDKYFYKFSSKNRSGIILATTKEEINLLQSELKNFNLILELK